MVKLRMLLASSVIAAIAAATMPAAAQTVPPSDRAAPATVENADGTKSADETIIVTGSRIRRPNSASKEPTLTVDRQYIDERNITNVADALNELPGFRGSVTPAGAQGGFGQAVNFPNALNLGSNRTLTLINGRRSVTSNVVTQFGQATAGTQVDLNTIPSALVERIDTVFIGGAPVYGSDAIAATVNLILKTNFTGVLFSGTNGITQEGDNRRYNATVVAGTNFSNGKGNITVSVAQDQVNGVLLNDRGFLRNNYGNVTNPSTAQAAALGLAGRTPANDGRVDPTIGFNDPGAGFPGTVLVRDVTISYLARGGLITSANSAGSSAVRNFQFNSQGNLIPFNRGIPFVGVNSSGGDGFNFNDYAQITSQLRRTTANGFLSYDFDDAIKLFVESTYYHSKGNQLVRQPTFNSSLFGGFSGPLQFDITTPFLTAQARSTLQAAGVTNFGVSRASSDLADLSGFSTTDVYRLVGGFKGNVNVGSHALNYEISGNYGRNNTIDTGQDLNAQKFINAVNVTTNAAGQIVCTTTPTRQAAGGGTPVADPACVPLNLLGEGLSTQAARDYVISINKTRSVLEQLVFNANVGGNLFNLFGNSIGFNIGAEHREERGRFTPSDFQQQGLGRSVAILPVAGKYIVNEGFGEVLVPIVQPRNDVRFVYRLETFARARYVSNSVNGGFTSYAAGGSYAPIKDIEFRGNYTKSFRAPAITELFLPRSSAFSQVLDLCSPANRIAGAVPDVRTRNCLAFLAKYPNATPLDAASATVPSISGGNPNLKNEIAYSYTYGGILRPRFIPGLTIAADYLHIDIRNPIANLSVASINSACFDNANFNVADPANGNAFCSQIKRYAAGQGGPAANGGDRGGQVIADNANPGVSSGYINGNRILFSGVQGELDYRRPLTALGLPGDIDITADALFVEYRLVDTTGIAPLRSDGLLNDPKISGQLNVRYIGDNFGIHSSFDFIGKQLFAIKPRGPSIREFDSLRGFTTVNAGFYIDGGEKKQFRFTVEVTNVLNRQGQSFNGVLIPASYNDLLGRRYAVSAKVRY